jgi:hypothetical protein
LLHREACSLLARFVASKSGFLGFSAELKSALFVGPINMNRLFALPEYEDAFVDFVHTAILELKRRKDPLLSRIRVEYSEEIHTSQNTMPSGEVVETRPFQVRMPIAIELDDAIAGRSNGLTAAIDNAAEEGLKIGMPRIFEQLGRVCEAAGTATDARGQPLSRALILQALEKMEIDFDEDGKANIGVMVGPETYKQFQNLPPPTPEEVQALNELLERKRAEFYARQRHRKLS